MQVIGLLGYVDKYDIIMNLAKTINLVDKSVLVIDATLDRKLKYIIPALDNVGRAYVTQYNNIDFAVGFDSMHDVENYMAEQSINIGLYDFVLIDMDSARSYEFFRTRGLDKICFFIDTSVLSVAKNKDIIKAMKVYNNEESSNKEIIKILYRSYISRAANDYFEQQIKEYDVKWKEPEYEIELTDQDKLVDIDSQFSGIIDTKKHTKMYITTLADLTADLVGDINAKQVLTAIKRGKF